MNKTFVVAWVVVFIVVMLSGFVVHGMLLGADYAKLPNMFRPQAEGQQYMPFLILAHVIWAAAFVWIYARGAEAKPWVGQGIRYGIVIALLTAVPTYLIYYAVQPMPGVHVVKQIVFESVAHVIQGIVVAWFYRNSGRTV